jgi:capsular polysaccharide biosynthesis protein
VLLLLSYTTRRDAALRLCARSCLPASANIGSDLCSLLDFRGWHSLYYHWFLDCLPRILAAEHHLQLTGRPCTFLVPHQLTAWQNESLHRLGYGGSDRMLRHSPQRHTNIRTPCLIAFSSHRHQHATQAPFDALSSHLSTRGFSSIDLQGLSLTQQIALFRNASHIIALSCWRSSRRNMAFGRITFRSPASTI